jgi:hypothetical protein
VNGIAGAGVIELKGQEFTGGQTIADAAKGNAGIGKTA